MTNRSPFIALTIAGSDPSGGAGLQADLKTFHHHRVFGTSVVTLITAQNTHGVTAVQTLSPDLVQQQLEAVLSDMPPQACKTGALGSISVMNVVVTALKNATFPRIFDPVMVSKHGHALIEEEAIDYFREQLVPLADVLTPNRFELEKLAQRSISTLDEARAAAQILHSQGTKNILIKFGRHLGLNHLILSDGHQFEIIKQPHLESRSLHGTGCVLSACITARLARGELLDAAVHSAIEDVHRAIRTAPAVGKSFLEKTGFGPINMNFDD